MILGQVFEGIGLGAYGVGFYALARWTVRDDARLHRMARSRWWFDRRAAGKLRRGEISQEEWFDRFARGQRSIVKWVFTPVIALWSALCVATTIQGLISRR